MMRPQLKLARDLGLLWVGQILTKGIAFLAFAILAALVVAGIIFALKK